ncbi:MAG: hypothetical protein GF401_20980 [Chitinivibrionales bacterium]|nr:hypothetical protein [Chitinivibrionales bacterium]
MTLSKENHGSDENSRIHWHSISVEKVLGHLGSGPDGLSAEAARSRLEKHGHNRLVSRDQSNAWRLLLSQFQNVLILILLAATVLSGVLGHGIEAVAISVIVLFAVLLGFLQEFRAEKALEALGELAAPVARVLRDGTEIEIPAAEIVPGDVRRTACTCTGRYVHFTDHDPVFQSLQFSFQRHIHSCRKSF